MKNYTEKEYNNNTVISIDVYEIMVRLGIDDKKWYFGEAVEGDGWFNVYFSNKIMEDHTLNFDFIFKNNKWYLEKVEIIQD